MSPNNTGKLHSVKTRWLWIRFWRITLVVSIFYAWYCFYVPSNSIAWADDEVMKTVNSDFAPVTIDVDNPNNAPLLVRYNVGGTPITIVTDPNGKALRWRVGGIGKSDFLKLLQGMTPSTH